MTVTRETGRVQERRILVNAGRERLFSPANLL
jgi:hypothetical protein